MKTILLDKPLTIAFVNENSETTAQIINPPANFIIPRIGEHFEILEESRTNIVTSVYHDYFNNEITIFYDFFMCYDDILNHSDFDTNKTPEENLMRQ